eukprot:579303-Amphidinium_carterae.1
MVCRAVQMIPMREALMLFHREKGVALPKGVVMVAIAGLVASSGTTRREHKIVATEIITIATPQNEKL